MKITFLVSGNVQSNFSYRALTLARFLHKRGHAVSIIAPCADKYNNFVPNTQRDIDGVRILQPFQFTTRRAEINLLPYIFGATGMLFRERPDMVFIYKPTPASVVGLLLKFFRKTPVVADFDDIGAEVMRDEGHPAHQRKLVEYSERLALRFADRLVVATTYLQKIYSSAYPHKPILLLPNGVEPSWLGPTIASKQSKGIVFMGSINRRSILEPLFAILPQIIAEHPETQCDIIGDGSYAQYFKDKAAADGIEAHVRFSGWLPIEKAKDRLYAGDIGYCVMPAGKATQAASYMKVPQYMARGVVPLVSDVGDLRATVEDGVAGYVCSPDSLESLRKTILLALSDPHRLEKSARACEVSEEKLNWETLSEKFDSWIS